MEYNYEIDYDKKVIIVNVQGVLTEKETALMGLKIRLLAKELKVGIIFDLRQAENAISMSIAYFWVSNYYDKTDYLLRSIPTVHLCNEIDIEFFSFVEVAWTNKGTYVKMCTNLEEALKWICPYRKV